MLDLKDFNILENTNNFDVKAFLVKVASYWKWFLFSLALCFFIAYQINLRKQKIYNLDTTIVVKDENNSLFTTNTSLIFNWGGTSDKVQTITSTLKSRSHNEKVVDALQFYINYLEESKYFTKDVYGQIPFEIKIDKSKNQLLNIPIEINFLSQTEYEIKINFENPEVNVTNYSNFKNNKTVVNTGEFIEKHLIGEKINLPFLNLILYSKNLPGNSVGKKYKIVFRNFDEVVSEYQQIKVSSDEKSGAILKLSLDGNNKNRIVDYLNKTVNILIKSQLDYKNQFAINTISFIDTTLVLMEDNLNKAKGELKSFSKGKNIIQLESGGRDVQNLAETYDLQRDEINKKINYYNTLNTYLKNSKDYSKLPAPTVAGIDDPNILNNVSRIIQLSVERSNMDYTVKSDLMFERFDSEISSVKNVLLENIKSARNAIQYELGQINSNLGQVESKIRELPEEKQEYVDILRKYELSGTVYRDYMQKRNEAMIMKASNLSDIQFIDSAKDIGKGLIGPRTSINYILAFFFGILIPLLIIITLFFINNSIQNTDDFTNLTQIPLIGVVGLKHSNSNLSVFEKPKSPLAESFRSIRTSLQFLYKKQNLDGAKTLMLTSSISGEGKTFCSINIATVFALSDKKTVVVGIDLRKPKIFDDFNLKNDIGVVNYLIGQKSITEIIQKTNIPNLDVITSGPIPPNPSELILSESMNELIDELKQKYDYIILDTPPVGLVTDALELSQFADVTLYITRQNYTKKEMINVLNNRVKRGELNNVSLVLNGFENKAKYGHGNGYGYGYGYGEYSNGYLEVEKPVSLIKSIINKIVKKK